MAQGSSWQCVIGRAAEAWAILAGIVLLAITAVTVINVSGFAVDTLTRPFGIRVPGLSGYEEMVRLWVGPAAFMMLPYCQQKYGHVAVDFVIANAPAAVQKLIDLVSLVATLALALFLTYWMWAGMVDARRDGLISHLLGWQEWVYFIPGLISFLLWAAVILSLLADMAAGRSPDHGVAGQDV
ncbi:MAG: TRAP transporter small permease [Alphaproteobacteria bacterium]|nr:TRAP transporter small permease [Alphaproteobacteria bacterium]